MVNYDTDRGYNVSTDLNGKESWLEVARATARHSGNYTCDASNAKPTRVLIQIFDGDNPAAMQHSNAALSSPYLTPFLYFFVTLAAHSIFVILFWRGIEYRV